MGRWIQIGAILALLLAAAGTSATGKEPRVSLASRPSSVVAGRAWNAVVVMRGARPAAIAVTATLGARRISARGRRSAGGRYRVRLVLPVAGRWTLLARIGSKRFALGAVSVRPRPPAPIVLSGSTEAVVDPSGSLLVVERGANRVVRIDAVTGGIAPVVTEPRPYGLALAPSGDLYVSAGSSVLRFDAARQRSVVAQMDAEVGPLAVDAAGNLFLATSTRIFRIPGGGGPVQHIAGTGVTGNSGDGGPALAAQFDAPHGLAVIEGALLFSDGGNDRIRRIDLATGMISAVAPIVGPGGLAAGPDGSLYVCEVRMNRVRRFDRPSSSGSSTVVAGTGVAGSTGDGGPATAATLVAPADVGVAADGTLFVPEGTPSGRVRRIDPAGRISTLRR